MIASLPAKLNRRGCLVCTVVGCFVQIIWSKDGKQVRGNTHYQVENAADRGNYWSRLSVYDVQAGDSGQFSVTAVNGFGNVTSSTSLTVRGLTAFKRCLVFFIH